MLLSITSKHSSATDLSYLLHKHPGRFQSYDLSFGQAHVFYTAAAADCCTAACCWTSTPSAWSAAREQATGCSLSMSTIAVTPLRRS